MNYLCSEATICKKDFVITDNKLYEKRYTEGQKDCQSERVDGEIEIKLKIGKKKGGRV